MVDEEGKALKGTVSNYIREGQNKTARQFANSKYIQDEALKGDVGIRFEEYGNDAVKELGNVKNIIKQAENNAYKEAGITNDTIIDLSKSDTLRDVNTALKEFYDEVSAFANSTKADLNYGQNLYKDLQNLVKDGKDLTFGNLKRITNKLYNDKQKFFKDATKGSGSEEYKLASKLYNIFKDLKYNESYQYEYSYIYRSDLGVVNFESDVYSGYIYKDRFSTLITVTAGTPYDVGLTYATIPVQLNLFDNCVKKVGVEYWYSDEYNSTKKVEYIENLKDKVSNITISCQRTDKITSYRCYAEDESGNVVYSKTSTLNFPAVDEGLAVDLGLSVKWAPFNVGSRKENVQKWYYYQGKEYLNQSSICGNSDCDIVMMYWGNKWRTPNKAQIEELIEKCTWEKVINKTHNGYKVIGPNGNSIFIPSGGYYDDYVRNKQDAIIISGSYHSSYAAYGILNGQLFTSEYTHSCAYPIRAILPN